MSAMTLLDWSIFLGYVVAVVGMGFWFSREQHTNEDFLVGGRKMSWLPIGISMFASIFSSTSFVGLPPDAAYGTYSTFLAILCIPLVVVPISGWLFVPFFHRLRVISAYEYFELRFNRPLRLVASLLFSLYTFAWMGNLLYAVSHVARPIFHLAPQELSYTSCLLIGVGLFATFYTTIGGFKAVIWTDVLQAFALGGGMLLILVLAIGRVDGGVSGVWQIGQQYSKFEMFNMTWDPAMQAENFYSSMSIGLFSFLAWYAATLTAVQRYVAMPTIAAARRSLALNGVLVAVVCLLFFLVGSTLFAFYHQHLPAGSPAGAGFPDVSVLPKDQLLTRFVLTEIPSAGLLGLLVAGLFAAAMSSIDSGINALTATVVCDWLPGRKLSVNFSRLLCLVFGVGAIIASLLILYCGQNVFEVIIAISGTFLGLLLGLFLLGMLSARANSAGATIGLAAGILALSAGFYCKVNGAWFGALSCLPTLIVGWLASYGFPSPAAGQVTGLVLGHGAPGEVPGRVQEEV